MSEFENMDIQINLTGDATDAISSAEDTLLSIEQTDAAVSILLKKLREVSTLFNYEGENRLFGQDLNRQIQFTEQNIKRLRDIRLSVDRSLGEESRATETALFNQMFAYTKKRVDDLSSSMQVMHGLKDMMSTSDFADFSAVMKKAYAPMRSALESYAKSATKALGTQTPEYLIDSFMKTPEYRSIVSGYHAPHSNSHIFNQNNMKQYLKSIAVTAIPTRLNQEYADWTGDRRSVQNVQQLLPESFKNIRLGRVAAPTRTGAHESFSQKLSKDELSMLEKIITENQYVAREAESAGLIKRHHGNLFMNKAATRGNVNAFAGEIAHLFSLGAMGLPMYGVEDIYDVKHLNSIASKTNKSISQARRVADMLHSQYRVWLDPAYHEALPSLSDKAYDWYDAGKVKASGRQDRMQFLEIDPSELSADGTIAFRDGQKRWTPVVKSAYQSYLSKQDVATKFTHNGINDNEIFVKLPNDQYAEALHGKDADRQKALEAEVARVIGTHIQHDGRSYTMTGLTKTHIAYTRDDIIDAITKNPEDKDFFYNGESRRKFNTYQDFAKAATYRRLMRTEGEDLSEIYGFDTNELRVLVADIKKLSGSDGQNIVNNKLFPEGFQSRSFAGKSTNSPLDFEWMKKVYGDPETGLVTLPGAGLGGVDLVFNPDDYDIIEDVENIKTNKDVWKGMSSQEAGRLRSAMYARYGVFGKTSYDAANTSSRYLSAQMANTMAFTPEAQRYFQGVYLSELAALDDVGMVIDLLFSGDDALSVDVRKDNTLINSQEAQKRINDYRDSLNRHNAEGDILLPRGTAQYGMAAGWVPDTLNNILVKGGKTLTEDQAKAGLGKDVFFLLNKSEELGLGRNPATFDGNIEAANKAADEYFQKLADMMGIDKNALYVNPEDTILERLQGADLDGDTIFTYAIKHSKDQRFADVMRATLVNTASRYKKILEIAQLNSEDPEQAKKAIEALTSGRIKSIEYDQDEFGADDPNDLVKLWKAQRENMLGMASADAITRNAMRMPLTKTVAAAINYASTNYNVNSTRDKKAEEYIASAEERKVLGYGAPVSYIADWVSKSTIEDPSKPNSPPVFNQEEFYKRYKDRILKTNFAAVNNQDDLISTMGRFYAAQVNGWDVSGGIDWDKIFDEMPTEYGDDTAAGGFIRRMNELRKQQLQGKFLVWSDETLREMGLRGMDAYREIEAAVNADNGVQNKDAEIAKRYAAIGGDVLQHIISNGITLGTLANNPDVAGDIQNLVDHIGADHVFSQFVEYDHAYSDKNYQANEQKLQQALDEESKLKEEQEALRKKQDDNNKRRQQLIEQRKTVEDQTEPTAIDPDLEAEKLQIEQDIERNSAQMASVQTTIADAQMYQKKAYDYYAAQGEYNRVFADAARFSGELHRNRRSFETKNDDVPYAERHFETVFHNVEAKTAALTSLMETWGANLDKTQEEAIKRLIRTLPGDAVGEITSSGVNYAKRMLESIKEREQKTGFQYDAEEHEINEYEDKIKEAYAQKTVFEKMLGQYGSDPELAENIKQSIADVENYIEQTEAIKHQLRGNLYERNVADDSKTITQMQRFTRDRQRRYSQSAFGRQLATDENDYEQYAQVHESLSRRLAKWQKRRSDLDDLGQQDTENYKTATREIERLSSALSDCQKEMDALSGKTGKLNAGLTVVGQAASRAITQFGHRMFNQAIQEATQFVQTYDAAMTEVQMVTLKTDEQIAALGEGFIDKAVDLKVNVADVTNAATSLYRQGLSDSDVDSRLEDVLKFSKTAGVGAEDAIKLATVAMNSGGIDDAQRAFDVVSALGDSAATEAAQITKGLMKSMAAANSVGVSFEELVAMLTVITSKTQLSGSVAGTTMRNVMSRGTRFGEEGTQYARQAQMLKNAGIDVFDQDGQLREVTDILVDIGKRWDSFESDDTRYSIARALGGTEQFSNVMALMQGFSEIDEVTGLTFIEKYLQLAAGSTGVTDAKYEHYLNSLTAAVSNLKTSFDQLVASAEGTGVVIDFIDLISDGVAGFAELNTHTDGLLTKFAAMITVLVSIAGLINTNPYLLAIIGIWTGLSFAGKSIKNWYDGKQPMSISQQREQMNGSYQTIQKQVAKATEINSSRDAAGNLNDNESAELRQLLTGLHVGGYLSFDGLTDSTGAAITSIDQLAKSADATATALTNTADTITQDQTQKNETLSILAADRVSTDSKGYEAAKTDNAYKTINRFVQDLETADGQTYTAASAVAAFLTPATSQEVVENKINHPGFAHAEMYTYDFANALYEAGALDFTQLTDKSKHIASLRAAGDTKAWKDIVSDIMINGADAHETGVVDAIYKYATDPAALAAYLPAMQSYGEYYRDDIRESVIRRPGVNVEESGLLDPFVDALVEDVSAKKIADPTFNYNNYLSSIMATGWEAYVAEKRPDEYAQAKTTQEVVTANMSPFAKISAKAEEIRGERKDVDYEDGWLAMMDILRTAEGLTAAEKLSFFADKTITDIADWDDMIKAKGSEDLVDAWMAMVEVDKDGKYQIRADVTDDEYNEFIRLISGMSDRTKIMGQYRPAETIGAAAKNTLSRIKSEGRDAWAHLSPIDTLNQLSQQEFIQVLDEPLVQRLLANPQDAELMNYAERKISSYQAAARIKPGYHQDVVKGIVQGLTGSREAQMNQYSQIYKEIGKYEKGQYAMDRILAGRGDEQSYSLVAQAIGEDADFVERQSRTEEGRQYLSKMLATQVELYQDVLSQAIYALLDPEDVAQLTEDMDSESLLKFLEDKLSEDVYAAIKTIIESFDVTYKAQSTKIEVPIDADSGSLTPWNAMLAEQRKWSSKNRDDEMLNHLKIAVTDGGNMGAYLEQNAADEDWSTFFSNNSLIHAAFRSYGENEGIIDREQMLALINNTLYGGSKDADYYNTGAAILLGDDYQQGDWDGILQHYASVRNTYLGDAMMDSMSDNEEFVDFIHVLNEGLQNGTVNASNASESLKRFNDSMASDKVAEHLKYNKSMQKIVDTMRAIRSGGKEAAAAYADMHNEINNVRNFKDALEQYKTGNRNENVLNVLQNNSEYSADDLKRFKSGTLDYEVAISNLDVTYDAAIQELEDILDNAFMPQINNAVTAFEAANPGIEIDMGSLWVKSGYNLSSFVTMLQDMGVDISANVAALASQLSGVGIGINGEFDAETGAFIFNTDATGLKGSTSYRSGGGGGSKKSSADKLVERLGHGQNLYEHQIKMVQYEQTKYQNADELGNYGKMLEEELEIERAYLPVLESNIAALRSELGNIKEGSEDWYKLRDAILEAEESYADINNTIQENEKKLEENHQAILKLHTDLEDMVVGEIELRIDAEKEMLDGSVSMQDTVLNAIKQRYQDEWDLIKQDIEKKKEALQQEKNLIDERLDARREAEDEAAKYEELAELKKQLSLISMDSTRTKDAAALRESIAELEKEIGWDIAEKQAENEKNAIQDQIDAYDDYATKGDEDLNELLSDANNFAEEVNGVMKLNQTELFDWLKQNIKEYANSLDDAQKQMVQSWEATYKQMLGITDTYWDEVNAILSSKDVFLDYMKQSNEYIYASEDERAQLLYQWEEAYDKWRKAQKNDADYSHGDSGLGSWSGSEYTGSSSGSSGSGGSSSSSSDTSSNAGSSIAPSVTSKYGVFDYDGNHRGWSSSLSDAMAVARSVAKNTGETAYITDSAGKIISSCAPDGSFKNSTTSSGSTSSGASASSGDLPETGWPTSVSGGHGYYYKVTADGKNVQGTLGGPYSSREAAQAAAAIEAAKHKGKYQTKYFLRGGIADFTGPAWLDGTPSEPERILSADQTRDFEKLVSIMDDFRNAGISMDVLRGMARWSTSVSVPSSLSHVGGAAYQGNSANIGDIFVNITEAQISDDRDIEVLANIVGEKFVKEIGKQGFNVSRYNF